ncbi:hypothetical protein GCM10012286_34960 [Streptomyces lasiicapitis]|uniref:Uncharacterized protein n=1 Tax=Streptomyces lasiicapitis TaxID=1923961 RepID=A0ABQ2M1J0_9ACTN|nr:hypothetical protein GCM10012286_34960 [Streptomyces lasiicapitis]
MTRRVVPPRCEQPLGGQQERRQITTFGSGLALGDLPVGSLSAGEEAGERLARRRVARADRACAQMYRAVYVTSQSASLAARR